MKRLFLLVVMISVPWNVFSDQTSETDWVQITQHTSKVPANMNPPRDLIQSNIETTDYTAIVLLQKAKVTGKNGEKPSLKGYVNHVYQAKVIETLKGPTLETITYSVMADADIRLRLFDFPMIVSLCKSDTGELHVPDNGYLFGASEATIKLARNAAKKKPEAGLKNICRDE